MIQRKHLIFIACLFVYLGAVIYSNTLNAEFQFDDSTGIRDNPAVRDLGAIPTIWHAFRTRFVLGLSFAINFALHGYHVQGYHIVNTGIHILNTFLVYAFIFLTCRTPVFKSSFARTKGHWIALITGLIFLTHPLQTESVTYIWQRGTSLVSCLILSSLCLYVLGRLQGKRRFIISSFVLLLVALITKELSFLLPFMLLIYELFFFPHRPSWKALCLRLAPFFIVLAIIPAILLIKAPASLNFMEIQRVSGDHESWLGALTELTRTTTKDDFTRSQYLLTQLNVLRTYLRLIVYPVNQNVDYSYPLANTLFELKILWSLLTLGSLIGIAVLSFKRQRLLSFGIVWFLHFLTLEWLVMLPDLVFEHRLYLPLVGFGLVASTLMVSGLRKPRLIVSAALIITCIFSIATYRRNQVWLTPYSLWRDAIKKSPLKPRVNQNLGVVFFRKGQYKRAIEFSGRAIELNPNYPVPYHVLAFSYGKLGHVQPMIFYAKKALELEPEVAKHWVDVAIALGEAGKFEEAITYAKEGLKIDPVNVSALDQLGYLSFKLGLQAEARQYYEQALAINPGFFKTLAKLGMLYASEGKDLEAEKLFRQSISMRPEHAGSYYNMGLLFEDRKDLKQAEIYYLKSLARMPGYAKVHERLAHIYRAQGDWEKARHHKDRANRHAFFLLPNPKMGYSMSEINPN